MAKHLFLFAVGVFALTACTSESVIDDEVAARNLITFDNVVNKPSRAAVDLDGNTFNQFNVFGFYTMPDKPLHAHEVFYNVPVTKSGSNWSYQPQYNRYWVPGALYYFYAYSCGSSALDTNTYGKFRVDMETGEKDASLRTLEIDEYICDYNHQHDLLFASQIGYEATNGSVALQFKHILAKIQARFTNTFSSEYDVVIKKVTVEDICNQADYHFLTGWKEIKRKAGAPIVYLLNPTGAGNVEADTPITVSNVKVGDGENAKQMTVDSKAAYVIPCDYTLLDDEKVYLNILIDVKYKDDVVIKDKALTATLNPNWKEGYSYIYNVELNAININLDQITFTTDEIIGWNTDEENQNGILD